MTRCFLNGGALSYALRLLPSPLNTIGRGFARRFAAPTPAAAATADAAEQQRGDRDGG